MIKNFLKCFKADLCLGILIFVVLCIIAIINPTETVGAWINELIMANWISKLIGVWFLLALVSPLMKSSMSINFVTKYLGTLLLGAATAALAANFFVFIITNIRVMLDTNTRQIFGFINFCITGTNLLQILFITISIMLSKYSLTQEWKTKKKLFFIMLAIFIFLLHLCFFGLCQK
ncbi:MULTISPECIES: hypothetical protein [unclassified Eikenella]|uniref:hypothetical protein n=1 Tax=unclassified Eikenella TaxID=2639367 RepID=UPI0008A14CCA|nr:MULTISPECIES: hypothetical protein [unclassified Eikenella]OFK88760.1 hypothetical protein HMPREF2796_04270 [Eikenella sp. HMSC071B05]OFO45504.1 hypothetical protein HMPREF3043_05575 [Eikenella sp. HMSC073A11]